jgi:cytochrome P450
MASMPWTTIFRFNPIIGYLAKENNAFPRFVGRQIQEHGRKLQESKMSGGDVSSENGTRDFLYRFMMIHASKPEVLPQADIFKACMANVVAGSDTTAITLRAIMYLVLKHPEVKAKLLQELREGNLSFPVTWKESQQLPYLDACVKEALRVHPAVGMGLERFVPKEGLVMPDGHTLPEGTQVCMNAYVVHQDTSIFGADASVFNPDRWLQAEGESDDAYESRMASMKRTDLAFGWGKRICLGRNISYLEIYKAVPTLLLEFDIELVNEGNWKTSNRFFVRQSNMDCYLKRRVR